MRVAIISDKVAPFFIGGYENRLYHLALRLSTMHEIQVFSSVPGGARTIGSIHFKSICPSWVQREQSGQRSIGHGILFSAALVRCPFESFCPQVTIVESIPYLHLLTMNHWATSNKSLFLVDVNEVWTNYRSSVHPFASALSPLARHCLRSSRSWSDVFISISRSTGRVLSSELGLSRERVIVVPLGFDPSINVEHFRREMDSPKFDVATTGRLVPIKRHVELLKALSVLAHKRGWRGKCAVIGSGPLEEALRTFAKSIGLKEQVEFLGFVSEAEKERILAGSKVFALTSEREGFSLATLEAMALGAVPVVARPTSDDVFGVSDLVENNITGLIYPIGDEVRLADSIWRLLSDDGERTRLRKNALNKASKYRWSSISDDLNLHLMRLSGS